MSKTLKEEFSALRSSGPYKIRRDKGFIQDATPQMSQRYWMQKAQEYNTFYQKEQMFGELEKLEPMLVDLFKQISYITEFINSQQNQPLINKKQLESLRKIVKILNKLNTAVSTKILNELDKLGVGGENSQEKQYF